MEQRVKTFLRRLKENWTGRPASFIVMARALNEKDRAQDLEQSGVLESGVGATWEESLAFFDRNGFGGGWGEKMRVAGHRCFVVKHEGAVVAGGWMAYQPEWAYEVGYLFDCGDDGCYMFGDFVEPAMRGRWLQAKLGRHRLCVAIRDGKKWTYGLIWEGNAPSLKNSERNGLVRAGKISGRFMGPWQRDRVETLTEGVPHGRFVTRDGREVGAGRWRWKYAPEREAA